MGVGERLGGGAGGVDVDDLEIIDDCLTRVAALGDPAAAIYARLFAVHPEMEALFARDVDGSIKGHMLLEAIEAARDLSGAGVYGAHFIANEWVNHQNLGVPGDRYATFYDAMIETFRAMLGAEWSAEIEGAWGRVRAAVSDAIAARG
ncbi:MAG: globin [Alphaproteobacteria bacterium]|nr:globin [Alphaproteobacteria bacterium]